MTKSDGVRVHHDKKSDGVSVDHERKSDEVRFYNDKEPWGDTSP